MTHAGTGPIAASLGYEQMDTAALDSMVDDVIASNPEESIDGHQTFLAFMPLAASLNREKRNYTKL